MWRKRRRSSSIPGVRRWCGSGPTRDGTTWRAGMIVGVPKEIKTNENRVALVPAGAEAIAADGHTVLVEQGAGLVSGFTDEAYRAVGATVAATADEVWAKAEMICKVKEPIESEWPKMRAGQV